MNLEYIKEYPLTLMGFDSISEGMVLHLVKSLGFSEYDYDYDNIELYVSRLIRDKKICNVLYDEEQKIKLHISIPDFIYNRGIAGKCQTDLLSAQMVKKLVYVVADLSRKYKMSVIFTTQYRSAERRV